jgi:hypothetical protein
MKLLCHLSFGAERYESIDPRLEVLDMIYYAEHDIAASSFVVRPNGIKDSYTVWIIRIVEAILIKL